MSTASTGPRAVRALARVEGRRLLTHPAVLAGAAFTVIGVAVFVRATLVDPTAAWDDDAWTVAAGVEIFAILTMVAANLAALRDRREDTLEQHETMPVARATRIGGLIASTLWPALLATVVLAAVAVFAASQLPLPGAEFVILAQLLLVVALLGTLGIALATWAPNVFVAPVVAWGLFLFHPGERPEAWHALTLVADPGTVGLAVWRLVYLLGLIGLLGVVAVGRSARPRSLLVAGAVALTVVAISSLMLVSGSCPSGVCVA